MVNTSKQFEWTMTVRSAFIIGRITHAHERLKNELRCCKSPTIISQYLSLSLCGSLSLSRCVTCFLSYTHRSIASSSLVSSAENDKQIYTSFSLALSLSRSLLTDADTHTQKHTRGRNMFLAERETKQPDRKHSSSRTVAERHTKHTEHSVNNSN